MSDAWWRLAVSCNSIDTELLAAELVTLSGHAVEEAAPGSVLAIAGSEPAARAIFDTISARRPDITGTITQLAPVDWSVQWRDGITARRFGRLVLSPSWIVPELGPGDVGVVLDPENAFGSGEHGSTRAALALLERQLQAGDTVLDLGSGSGILAIAAVQLGAGSAIGIEVDPDSNTVADSNAARNGVADRVAFLLGDAGELAVLAGPARIVCSNILRTINTILLPQVAKALAPGGIAIFAGMEDIEEDLFRPVLQSAGFVIVDDQHDAGWWGVAARLA
ncbi:MAG: 50S ribosomal protein L11 methyltransferase [Gemmatimonadales bacterium]|nr:50S ribosomal protein L11 methyltransferase [Gemmatimonadales bacterium]